MFPLNIKTIHETFVGEFKSLNSKFIAYVFPFHQKEVLQGILGQLKKEHPKASHWCYAYRVGYQNEEFRANDDGEPSGSAGKPILNQLYSHEVKNALIVVVRYFGGTKLGVGGLISAYRTSAQMALETSEIIEKTINIHYIVSFDYKNMNKVMRVIKEKNLEIISQNMNESCGIEIATRKKNAEQIVDIFNNLFEIEIKLKD
jgi:uncharacterized YigZ family protein